MKSKLIRGTIYTIVILAHLILLGTALTAKKKSQKNKKGNSIPTVKFIPKTQNVPVTIKEITRTGKPVSTPKKKLDCDESKTYIGVGFTNSFALTEPSVVLQVAVGYAAHRAGLRVGDQLEGMLDSRLGDGVLPLGRTRDGKEGDPLTLLVLRDGVSIKMRMLRERICME